MCEVPGSSRLLLLTLVAFVLPLVVIVVVVNFLESHIGSVLAAIAGVAAAGSAIAFAAGIEKFFTGKSAVRGAGP